jgi:hypothetical protein
MLQKVMRLMKTILILILLYSFSPNTNKKQQVEKKKPDTIIVYSSKMSSPVKSKDDDTIFYNDRFLIIGSKEMKIDFLPSGQKSIKPFRSKGDTLFHDDKVTILGDKKYLYWVYVRYNSKFKFQQFKVNSIYKGELAKPDLTSNPDAKGWRTQIIKGCKNNGVNFAGHYTIVQWGCGSMCEMMAIIDRINGKIYFPDIPESHIDGYYGARFKINSRMIISNSGVLDDYKGYYLIRYTIYTQVFVWKNSVSKRVE